MKQHMPLALGRSRLLTDWTKNHVFCFIEAMYVRLRTKAPKNDDQLTQGQANDRHESRRQGYDTLQIMCCKQASVLKFKRLSRSYEMHKSFYGYLKGCGPWQRPYSLEDPPAGPITCIACSSTAWRSVIRRSYPATSASPELYASHELPACIGVANGWCLGTRRLQ